MTSAVAVSVTEEVHIVAEGPLERDIVGDRLADVEIIPEMGNDVVATALERAACVGCQRIAEEGSRLLFSNLSLRRSVDADNCQ